MDTAEIHENGVKACKEGGIALKRLIMRQIYTGITSLKDQKGEIQDTDVNVSFITPYMNSLKSFVVLALKFGSCSILN